MKRLLQHGLEPPERPKWLLEHALERPERSKSLLEVTVRKNCSKWLLEVTVRKNCSLLHCPLHPPCSAHLATCMDMHGFTLAYIYIYICCCCCCCATIHRGDVEAWSKAGSFPHRGGSQQDQPPQARGPGKKRGRGEGEEGRQTQTPGTSNTALKSPRRGVELTSQERGEARGNRKAGRGRGKGEEKIHAAAHVEL